MTEKTDQTLKKLVESATKDFLKMKIMEVTLSSPDLKELSYFNQKVVFEDGGEYMLSFMHISGPKMQFKEAKNKSEDV